MAERTNGLDRQDQRARGLGASGLTRREVLAGAALAGLGAMAAGAGVALADAPQGAPEGGQGGPGGDGSTPPDMPGGEGGQGGPGGQGGQGGPGGGADTMTFDYSGTYTGAIVADGEEVASDGEAYDAPEADENAALAQNAGVLTITNGTLTKSGDDENGDNCNFYGVNSIALAVGEGSALRLASTSLSATGEGSNGVFATDSGTAFVNGCSIATQAGNSRGLDATYSGVIVAADVDIQTQGDHCAAVATDRGGGEISVAGGTFATAGSGSPLLYSTGNIQVTDVTGTATGSQIAGMEGLNTILIANSTLESTNADRTGSDPVADGVIIYQSTSGDAESSTGEAATFQAVGSTLKSAIASGAMFYFTNTSANVVLSDTVLDFDASAAMLAYVAGNDANNWGSAGSNGATVAFTGIGQELAGDVVVDTISSLGMYLTEGTVWTGGAGIEENAAGSTVDAPLSVSVDAASTWVVTADSQVSELHVAEGGQVVDVDGNACTVVAGGETVVTGPSAITVNVAGAYDAEVALGDANALAGQDAMVDRSAFDEWAGTSTSWTMA